MIEGLRTASMTYSETLLMLNWPKWSRRNASQRSSTTPTLKRSKELKRKLSTMRIRPFLKLN